jgi:hypothetical protein
MVLERTWLNKTENCSTTELSFSSLTQGLQNNHLPSLTVELGVVDLLPRTEVKLAIGDRHDDLMMH